MDEAAERGVADEGHHTAASFADLDGDGDLDVFILAHRVDFKNLNNAITDPRFLPVADQSDRLYLNDGTGHFAEHSATAGTASRNWGLGVAIGDINGDGRNDIYTSCDYYSPNKLMINNGTRDGIPRFSDRALEFLRHTSYFAMGVDRGDLNNDGVADMMELDMAIGDHKLSKENMAGMKPDQFRNMVKNGMNHQYMAILQRSRRPHGWTRQTGAGAHSLWIWTMMVGRTFTLPMAFRAISEMLISTSRRMQ